MTVPIQQLQAPCIVPSWKGDERSDTQARYGAHYSTGDSAPAWLTTTTQLAFHKRCGGIVVFGLDAFCTACEDENLGDSDWEMRTVVPRTLADACWVAASDGECGNEYEDEDSGTVQHRGSRAALVRDLLEAGWRVLRDDRVFCTDDNPPDGAPEVAAVIPGQAPLLGKAGGDDA